MKTYHKVAIALVPYDANPRRIEFSEGQVAGETDGDDIAHYKPPYNLGPHWECVQWRHFVTFYCSLQPAYCSLQPRG